MSNDIRKTLEALIRAYVNLLENGRDRILQLGGDCDDVPSMEAPDPYLREARAALSQQPQAAQPAPSSPVGELPPLPEPAQDAESEGYMPGCPTPIPATPDFYTADQMRDYARAALSAQGREAP